MYKLISLALIVAVHGQALATEPVSPQSGKAPAEKTEKRRKKVAMCPTCGKPEPKCDCPGEKKGEHDEHEEHSEDRSAEKK